MKRRNIYTGLDILKLVCAVLIVYMHSFLHDLGFIGEWLKEAISTIGVPFFFITSGFLFSRKLYSHELSFEYFKKYNSHLIKMYFAWTIITLPVSWLCIEWGHGEYSLPLKIVYLFRMIFFSGSCGIYWYILSLIICSYIIYRFIKIDKIRYLYAIAIFFFAIGVWYDSPYNNHNIFFNFIHVVFGSERNFFNVGLFYMCVGHYLERYHIRATLPWLLCFFILTLALRSLEISTLRTNSLQAMLAIILFIFAYNWNPRITDKKSLMFRKFSTALYLMHFPFLLVYDYNFSRNTITGFCLAIFFSLVAYTVLKKLLSSHQIKILFG